MSKCLDYILTLCQFMTQQSGPWKHLQQVTCCNYSAGLQASFVYEESTKCKWHSPENWRPVSLISVACNLLN